MTKKEYLLLLARKLPTIISTFLTTHAVIADVDTATMVGELIVGGLFILLSERLSVRNVKSMKEDVCGRQ